MIPDSFIEELKYVSDIESTISSYVDLKKKGRNLSGLCPFHSEKTASFTVFPDTSSYYCFGCGNGGDVITFIRQAENLEYVEALKFLAEKSGLAFPEQGEDNTSRLRTMVLEVNRESAKFFNDLLMSEDGKEARAYLVDRGLNKKMIRRFGVGFAKEGWDTLKNHLRSRGYSREDLLAAAVVTQGRNNSVYDMFRDRIIFPIIDLRGNVIGFGGRLLGEKGPKYLNSPDTIVFKKSRNLFALNFAKTTGSDTLILGEGYMDVIAMHQAGFENSVATLGTSLTEEQARLISQYASKIIIAYDSDGAGQNATKRAINLFSKINCSVSVLEMDGAKDPDEYIQKFGATRFANLLEGGKSAIHFEIDKIKGKYDLKLSEDKVGFLGEFCLLMAGIDNPLQRDVYISEMATELGVNKDSIGTTVEGLRKKKFKVARTKESRALARGIPEQLGTTDKSAGKNIKSIAAEENIIMFLLKHPDCLKKLSTELSKTDFSDVGYGVIYEELTQKIRDNQPMELIYFSEKLSNELMGKLSSLIVKGERIPFLPNQGEDYAKIIRQESTKPTRKELSEISDEEYRKYIDNLRGSKK